MLLLDWMKSDVISIPPDTSLLQCRNLFKKHGISSLPVVDTEKNVVGIISASDIKAFMPQSSTGLEILEALDILNETMAKHVMTVAPVTINFKATVEDAAQLMTKKCIPRLPVVNDQGHLVGILTAWGVFKALVSISGAAIPKGVEVAFTFPNTQGRLRHVLQVLSDAGVRIGIIQSIITDDDMRQVKLSFWSDDPEIENRAFELVRHMDSLRYWKRGDNVYLCNDKGLNKQ